MSFLYTIFLIKIEISKKAANLDFVSVDGKVKDILFY